MTKEELNKLLQEAYQKGADQMLDITQEILITFINDWAKKVRLLHKEEKHESN